jgi:hypothetical protein
MHAPKVANPLGAIDHSLQQHGEAMERAIAEEEGGHESEPPNKAQDCVGKRKACQRMATDLNWKSILNLPFSNP